MSIRIASRFRAVSTSVSPFDTLDPDAATLTVSADSRFSANSNEMRVRVDASKNRLTIVDAAQRRHFLDRALADLLERLGGVENEPDLLGGQRLEAEQILAERSSRGSVRRSGVRSGRLQRRGASRSLRTTTASRPSSSSTNTSTR